MTKYVVGILGAGNMGKQLAILFASRGIYVLLWNHKIQVNFTKDFNKLLKIQSKLGNINKEQISKITDRVTYTNDINIMHDSDIIIEAVKEDKYVKFGVLKKIDSVAKNAQFISTNTSTLSILELGSCTSRPDRFLGIHFFNPPAMMRLVEVIKSELTTNETVFKAIEFLSTFDKTPVVLNDTPGFIVNRLLFSMINEAIFLLSEGVTDAKTIDRCMKLGANQPMGPLELADLIGLDVCLKILENLVKKTGDAKYKPAKLLENYVSVGKIGKKSGCGFYNYTTNVID